MVALAALMFYSLHVAEFNKITRILVLVNISVYFNSRAVFFFSSSSKVPPWGRFQPPSCPFRTTSPAQRSTAASSASTRASGKKRAAWWSSTTPCMRRRRASTSACPCPSGAVWESTTPPPRSRSWKTWTTVSLKADRVAGLSHLLTRCECFAQAADSDTCLHAWGFGVHSVCWMCRTPRS